MTNNQAREMICPLLSIGRDIVCMCKADKCMMWRWGKRYSKYETGIEPHKIGQIDESSGYCGLRKEEERW